MIFRSLSNKIKKIKYDKQVDELLSDLLKLPPKFHTIQEKLAKWKLPSEVLSRVACTLVSDYCFVEYEWAITHWEELRNEDYLLEKEELSKKGISMEERLVSFYLPEILRLFLDFGMNPNESVGEERERENIMKSLEYVDYKDYSARCLKLLLERGGDPNLVFDGLSIIDDVDSDVFIHSHNYIMHEDIEDYEILQRIVPYWLVLIGYGTRYNMSGSLPVTMLNGCQPEIFRKYYDYDWRIDRTNSDWKISIVEKATGNIVAQR